MTTPAFPLMALMSGKLIASPVDATTFGLELRGPSKVSSLTPLMVDISCDNTANHKSDICETPTLKMNVVNGSEAMYRYLENRRNWHDQLFRENCFCVSSHLESLHLPRGMYPCAIV